MNPNDPIEGLTFQVASLTPTEDLPIELRNPKPGDIRDWFALICRLYGSTHITETDAEVIERLINESIAKPGDTKNVAIGSPDRIIQFWYEPSLVS